MPLEQLLNEAVVMGSLFTTLEVGFTAALSWEQKRKQDKDNIIYISPFLNSIKSKERPLHGHSYPIMFAFGAMAAPYLQYVQPLVQQTIGSLGSYAVFGVGVCAVEYACGKITDTFSGKINFLGKPVTFDLAPWREVYQYLEQRVQETFPAMKKMPMPLTMGRKSVFLPLLPVWCAIGAFVEYVHEKLSGL